MNNLVNKCTNANIYLNGTSWMGRAEEITLPDISPKMVDHKALGMVGECELPAGLQKMSAKIKWNAIYPDVMKMTYNSFTAVQLQVRCNIETYEGGTRTTQQAAVVQIKGTWKKSGGMSFKPQDNVEMENEMNVTFYSLEVNKEVIVEIDVMNNKWTVNGTDQLEEYRKNLGLV